jgi:hypothetical protein
LLLPTLARRLRPSIKEAPAAAVADRTWSAGTRPTPACDRRYRQSGIYAREGIDLDRSTISGNWVGSITALVRPVVEAIGEHVCAGRVLHPDEGFGPPANVRRVLAQKMC